MTGEMNHVLAGSTANLNDVPAPSGEVFLQDRRDWLVVAMECRRVETTVRLDPATVPAKFDHIFSHVKLPEKREGDENKSRQSNARDRRRGPDQQIVAPIAMRKHTNRNLPRV